MSENMDIDITTKEGREALRLELNDLLCTNGRKYRFEAGKHIFVTLDALDQKDEELAKLKRDYEVDEERCPQCHINPCRWIDRGDGDYDLDTCHECELDRERDEARAEAKDLRLKLAEAQRESESRLRDIERMEQQLQYDTNRKELPKGLMVEHARLDIMWQSLVKERDEARAELAEERELRKALVALGERV